MKIFISKTVPLTGFWLVMMVVPFTGHAGQGVSRMLYTSPNMAFVENPAGNSGLVTINDTSGSVTTVQTLINSARAANPTNIIVIQLLTNATYLVGSSGITLGSHECLAASGATIQAANGAITVPLVTIASGSTNVSISGGLLDGGGANIQGIYAPSAARVNLDQVTVQNCGQNGIFLNGNGNTAYDNEMTVTRCEVSGSPAHAGISIQNSTQTAVLDNLCHHNGQGIWLSCAWANVANNVCASNTVGIDLAGGDDDVVANNTCTANGTGIVDSGLNNMVVSDALGNDSIAGINSGGSGTTFADNLFLSGNATNFISGGSGNHVISYQAPLNAPGQDYFYPPLINDQHTNLVVNGLGRTDLTVTSTTIDNVQGQYNSALAAHPNNVIVLHLNGSFTVGATPLTLQSNSCVLLNGTIQINSSTTASAAITAGPSPLHVSISGGTIDGGGLTGNNGVYIASGCMLQLDNVTLQNFGPDNPRVGSSDVVRFTGGATPQIITRCFINGGAARGIWLENSGVKRVVTDTQVTAVNMDGVDCDASTSGSVVKFNYCHDLVRYGVFFEQSASHNVALGNICNNDGRDINIYNNSVTPRGDTAFNNVLCNCLMGNNGIRNGSTGTNVVQSSHNFIFNNVIVNADIESQLYGTQNYYSQNYLAGGALQTAGVEAFFNSTDVSSNLYLQDGNSGLAMVVSNASTANNAPVIIASPSGLGNDQWALIPTDSGYVRITNKKSQLVLAVQGASLNAGASVVQYAFGSAKNDQWFPVSAGNGRYYFTNRLSGLSLDVPSGINGAQLDQQPYVGGAGQQFKLLITPPVAGRLNPFAVTVSPASQIVLAGGSNSFAVTVATNTNFTGAVNFSVSGLPSGASAGFNPVSLEGSGTSTLTVSTSSNTPVGVYSLTVTSAGNAATNTTTVSLDVNSSTTAQPGTLLWTDGSGTDDQWSTSLNWTNITSGGYGPPGALNDVVFTNLATAATSNAVDNLMNSDTGVASLTFNHTNGFHTTQIAPGATLSITGIKGVLVGTESDLGGTAVVSAAVTGSGGSLILSNTSASLIVRQGSATGGTQRAMLDLSSLDNFAATVSQVSVGVAGPVLRETGTLLLAKTNSIAASGFLGILVGDNGSNSGGSNYLYLGQSNAIFADSITIGRQKAAATLAFNPVFPDALAYIRNAAGTGRVASWNIGDNSAQSTSSSATHGTVDFSGGTVDALVDMLVIGKSQKSSGADTTGILTFASGTLDVNTLLVGYQSQSGATSAGNGTLNVNGNGALLNVNTLLELGDTSGGAGVANTVGTLNLNGGTVQATNIIGGGGSSVLNLNSGTVDLQGGQMTGLSSLRIGDGISPAAQLVNAASITSPNAILVAANGTLAGNTFITAPGLGVNGTIAPGVNGVGAITNSSNLTFGAGAVYAATVQDALGAPGTGWDFLQTAGQLSVSAGAGNSSTLQVRSFDPNGSGTVTNFNRNTNYDWTMAAAGGGIVNFSTSSFWVDTSRFQNDLAGGYFYIRTNLGGLVLSFTNNHPPVAGTNWVYATPTGVAIPISTLAAGWSDPDGDPVILSEVDATSSNGVVVNADDVSVYYTNSQVAADAIGYTVADVRTNPPAIYREGDTQRTATGEIILLPPPGLRGYIGSSSGLVLEGDGGIAHGSYSVLMTTNLTLPLPEWTMLTNGSFDGGGHFQLTNTTGAAPAFYLLQLP